MLPATKQCCLAISSYAKPDLKVHAAPFGASVESYGIFVIFVEKMHDHCTYIFMIYLMNFLHLPRFTFFCGGRCNNNKYSLLNCNYTVKLLQSTKMYD